MTEAIRVLIADDHPLFRDGLTALLTDGQDTELVGAATSGTEAVELARETQPDVVVMDLHMPGRERHRGHPPHRGRQPAHHGARADHVRRRRLDLLGAAGRRPRLPAQGRGPGADPRRHPGRGQRRDHLRDAAGRAHAGLLHAPVAAPAPVFPQLTDREREVLDLVAQGRANPAIAVKLGLSQKTVRNHVSNILTKLQVADRAQAIVQARDAGLGQQSRV